MGFAETLGSLAVDLRAQAWAWAAGVSWYWNWAGGCNNARAAGKDHPHAVRILARAWIRVIWRCWTDQVPYDPAKHRAAAALTEQTARQSAA